MRFSMRSFNVACISGLLLLSTAGGCAFGPRALERSYCPYFEAVREVDEEELLRNIVHMRYAEAPGALDVTSIAAQYELTAQAEARPFFTAQSSNGLFRSFLAILPDVFVEGANRPTISLVPGDDGTTVRRFLTPIPADTLVFLTQTSWPVSMILRLWVDRLNGVPNIATAMLAQQCTAADTARFDRIVELFQLAADRELVSVKFEERPLEVGGPLPAESVNGAAVVEAAKNGLEYRPTADGKSWMLLRRERRLVLEVTPGSQNSPELSELEGLLNLVPGQVQYDVIVASGQLPDPGLHHIAPSRTIRITSRSTAEVFLYLANGVEVPDEHLRCGLAAPLMGPQGDGPQRTRGLFTVHVATGHKPPCHAYLAVKYRGCWFYIDDRDQASKTTFAMTLQLSRLDFARQRLGSGPVLTLPAGR